MAFDEGFGLPTPAGRRPRGSIGTPAFNPPRQPISFKELQDHMRQSAMGNLGNAGIPGGPGQGVIDQRQLLQRLFEQMAMSAFQPQQPDPMMLPGMPFGQIGGLGRPVGSIGPPIPAFGTSTVRTGY